MWEKKNEKTFDRKKIPKKKQAKTMVKFGLGFTVLLKSSPPPQKKMFFFWGGGKT